MNVRENESMSASETPLIAHNSLFQQNSQVEQNQDFDFENMQSFGNNQFFNPHQNPIIYDMPKYTFSQTQELNLDINNANSLELDAPQTCYACSAILEADMPCLQLSDQCHL